MATMSSRLALVFRNFAVVFSSMIIGSLVTHEYFDQKLIKSDGIIIQKYIDSKQETISDSEKDLK